MRRFCDRSERELNQCEFRWLEVARNLADGGATFREQATMSATPPDLPSHELSRDSLDLGQAKGVKISVLVRKPLSSEEAGKLLAAALHGAPGRGRVIAVIQLLLDVPALSDEESMANRSPVTVVRYLYLSRGDGDSDDLESLCIPANAPVGGIVDEGRYLSIPRCGEDWSQYASAARRIEALLILSYSFRPREGLGRASYPICGPCSRSFALSASSDSGLSDTS